MKKAIKFIISLFFFHFCNNLQGQTGTYNFISYNLQIDLTEEMEKESNSKGIKSDKVFIGFDMTSDCKIENYKIERPGKLKSFTLEVEKQKSQIIKQLQNQVKCEGEKLIHRTVFIAVKYE